VDCFSLGGLVEMIALTALMCALLGYQVSMPAIDNAKYTFTVHKEQIVRMNTQNGSFEVCDEKLKCKPVEESK
jgi:hypothetical protein